jgi:hypothetical protein
LNIHKHLFPHVTSVFHVSCTNNIKQVFLYNYGSLLKIELVFRVRSYEKRLIKRALDSEDLRTEG